MHGTPKIRLFSKFQQHQSRPSLIGYYKFYADILVHEKAIRVFECMKVEYDN